MTCLILKMSPIENEHLKSRWAQAHWNQEQVCFFQRPQSTHGIFFTVEEHGNAGASVLAYTFITVAEQARRFLRLPLTDEALSQTLINFTP